MYIRLNSEENTHDFKMWRNGQQITFIYTLNAFKRENGGKNKGVLTIEEMIEEVDGIEVFVDQIEGRLSLSVTDRDCFFTHDEARTVEDKNGQILKLVHFISYEDFAKSYDQNVHRFEKANMVFPKNSKAIIRPHHIKKDDSNRKLKRPSRDDGIDHSYIWHQNDKEMLASKVNPYTIQFFIQVESLSPSSEGHIHIRERRVNKHFVPMIIKGK